VTVPSDQGSDNPKRDPHNVILRYVAEGRRWIGAITALIMAVSALLAVVLSRH